MERYVLYLIGPELSWAFAFMVTALLASRNQPPTPAGNRQLELIGWFLPFFAVVLSFVPMAWAPGNPWWWLLRIAFFGTGGIFFVVGHLCNGIDYQDGRNAGVGTAYVFFVSIGFASLALGLATAVFFLITGWHFVVFLKWGLILLALLALVWEVFCWFASKSRRPPTP